ncbi:putative H/ACA ribonucleoprotein complex subunit 1 [Araneus ventricosus]|uniref:H/ACA ribonucleoprotein complex subunit n=1 Tax=Araneus ventricosus TaxID=182803 RepID=A0A4Y2T6S8_ARAVE|nr:putative H/ACA ribonucleoprotein complex subunit 1 [Araneus ventricosus]
MYEMKGVGKYNKQRAFSLLSSSVLLPVLNEIKLASKDNRPCFNLLAMSRGFGGGGRGRGGFGGGGRGRGGGFGGRGGRGGRGGFRNFDSGPPEEVRELGFFTHPCEDDLVCKVTIDDVPFFNAPIYLENKQQIGKIDEIFGPIRDYVSFYI